MVYFTENIFKNILSYCDNRIERKQKKLMNNIIKDFTYLEKDLISSCFQEIINDNEYVISSFDEYIKDEEIKTKINALLEYSTYDYNDEIFDNYNIDLTNIFINKLIQK